MPKSHFLVIVVVPGNEQDFSHNDYSAVTFEDLKGLESSNQKTRSLREKICEFLQSREHSGAIMSKMCKT